MDKKRKINLRKMLKPREIERTKDGSGRAEKFRKTRADSKRSDLKRKKNSRNVDIIKRRIKKSEGSKKRRLIKRTRVKKNTRRSSKASRKIKKKNKL